MGGVDIVICFYIVFFSGIFLGLCVNGGEVQKYKQQALENLCRAEYAEHLVESWENDYDALLNECDGLYEEIERYENPFDRCKQNND